MNDMELNVADLKLPQVKPDLSGKVVLITGTTSGFGRRFAHVLADAGAKVAITGRRKDRLEQVGQEIEAIGGTYSSHALDVTDEKSVAQVVGEVTEELGPIDVLINNAGMNVQSLATEIKVEEFDQILATNMRGSFLMAQDVGRRMIDRGEGGTILNIGSIGSHTVLPYLTAYCMSKAAVAMMTRCLAREWARYLINVNALCPGYIETELNSDWFATEKGQAQIMGYPRRRLGLEPDLDGALLLLCSDQARIITGSLITIDDGQSL